VWFYTFTRRQRGRLRLSAEAFVAAVRGDFSGHERFL
jgi:rhamnopyranosyl-N-acetylglucosaminyl-diphospho-decaprenol beta-1,3/1,4-galactofuranosyltransferase